MAGMPLEVPIEDAVRRAQAGDREAFREIVRALEGELRLFVCGFQVSDGLADEIIQATFVAAFRKLALFRHEGTFLSWLRSIARNRLVEELRAQQRFARDANDRVQGLVVDSAIDDLERIEEVDARMRRLRACLDKLAPEARRLVEARYVGQAPFAELAAELRRTEVWVRVNLCRIRKALRQCIEGAAA
jgi:RNA polymerase sigma-70 factor (ECF subfamily)